MAHPHVNLLSTVPREHPLMLLCRQLVLFAISEDVTAHRASPAHSSHSSSTSLREKHAAPSFIPVETSLDDNKAHLERHLWNHYLWFTVSLFDRFDGHITLSTVWHFNLQEQGINSKSSIYVKITLNMVQNNTERQTKMLLQKKIKRCEQ